MTDATTEMSGRSSAPEGTQIDGGIAVDESTEAELADWRIEQIRDFDAGRLTTRQIRLLDEVTPNWHDDETRLFYRMNDDWSEDRMRTLLWPRIMLDDAGLLEDHVVRALDAGLSDSARDYCGLPPKGAVV